MKTHQMEIEPTREWLGTPQYMAVASSTGKRLEVEVTETHGKLAAFYVVRTAPKPVTFRSKMSVIHKGEDLAAGIAVYNDN